MKAARSWSAPPLVYLGRSQPGAPWTHKDRLLAEGLTFYEDSLNRHGIPWRLATDPDLDGWFEVDDSLVDHTEAALERWQKDTKSRVPGTVPRIVDTRGKD